MTPTTIPWRRAAKAAVAMLTMTVVLLGTSCTPGRIISVGAGTDFACVLHEGGEVLQHPDAPALALLGMELRGVDVAALQRRGEPDPVLTPR